MNIDNLTESEAFDLFYRLRAKFDWVGTVTTMGDVPVYRTGEEPWESDLELTDAMREAVRETYEWEKGITDYMAEAGNRLAPRIEVLGEDRFLVHTESGPPTLWTP